MTIATQDDVYVARQIILDRNEEIYGYELLFRNANSHRMEIESDLRATMHVLVHTLNTIGLNRILGEHKGFLNVNDQIMRAKVHESLDRKRFVLEFLESTIVTDELIEQVQGMYAQGYQFALDDFIFSSDMYQNFEPLFPYISILKVDVTMNTLDQLKPQLEEFHDRKIKLLAEKVETREVFKQCSDLGFEYFQGFFFAHPEIMRGQKLSPDHIALMQLIGILRNQPNDETLEKEFRRFPIITLNLLRYINRAHSNGAPFKSIKDVLNVIDRKHLLRWLMMMLALQSQSKDGRSAVADVASLRSKLMERIIQFKCGEHSPDSENAFLSGILSMAEPIFKIPVDQLLTEISAAPEVRDALLYRKGLLGQALELVEALETEEISKIDRCLSQLGMKDKDLAHITVESLDSEP